MQAMVPGTDDQFLLIAYGLGWQETTPENLLKCRVNKDGSFDVISGKGKAGKVSPKVTKKQVSNCFACINNSLKSSSTLLVVAS